MFKPLFNFRVSETIRVLMTNSVTVKVGDAVTPLSVAGTTNIVTNATGATAGAYYLLGAVNGFSKEDGSIISYGNDPLNTPAYVTTASDNTTVAKYYAVVIPFDAAQQWQLDVDAAVGTTTGSDDPYMYLNLADCRTGDESTVVPFDDVSAPLQILSLGAVYGETTKIISKVAKAIYLK